ncbi:putative fatty acyl-CoA reductase CG5065 isoform X1 [Cotesia glomerata]|uniref:Fatty acyl-CoA reductase n=1 Tax=Cotesia glomerata TaxID=32391 RepID=A0AAV7HBD3_COTGL|nr:putative fatty acyl-CoA reductase CG5065 isoform X1 [Cotesia glomerata]XP_044588077.1 putative fatty acyl-CoA reductase CG5065 isoform X1 [Cotesia glomerata]XP_044588078.1 putative fatty acyl-CoA reductase CG5065 isoform X1 [Cotesia glomerata]XP_044588079.1 putative fatty acyl-CoA reductase CG5065 isoform X1 [Cotesia glomerata]XP_044588080.1 putative fatty acyl-CoA reductase CG5065 isoform X1 [Cotesia glomerata]XP_044588081.1 putative fatty acyl-CoA reductase CG5065 isoform X1 [Cotesia glom
MEEEMELSPIQKFYSGKTIFVTGASGFMGKVLLEKLLYRCSDLTRIYILLRAKRGRSPEMRLDDMLKLPVFERIRTNKPHVLSKIKVLPGDIVEKNFGLNESQQNLLINEVDIIFHFAATLKLEAKLKDAIEMNAIGTAAVLELAKKIKKLKAFVHLSTAFCHVDQEELGECVYDSPENPNEVMRMTQWLKPEALELLTPKLLEPHPNTYTYSKRLAETLVANEYPNLPCVIARPSIVTPSWEEPVPGWVDSLNGPVGIIVGAGKGVIRSVHCNGHYHAQLIPVDLAINALIAIGHTIGATEQRPKNIPVYNITQSGVRPISWADVVQKGKTIAYNYPFEAGIWYPDGDIRSSKFIHNLFVLFFHILPAYLIDFLLLIFRQKRFMVHIQKRISDGLEVLQYFTTREWSFRNEQLIKLWQEMHPLDKKLFSIDFFAVEEAEYIKNIILGARVYCMKEKLETLPRARFHLKIQYVVHLLAVYGFYFGVAWLIVKNFESARLCLDFVTEKMKLLPIIGRFVEKIAPVLNK